MISALARMKRFGRDRRGLAAVEFAFIAPILCVMLGITVEIGRLLMAQHQFEAAVVGIARHVARYPEYEIRAREYALPVARSIFPGFEPSSFNVKVNSLLREGGILKEVFPGHVLTGADPGVDWRTHVKSVDYANDEAVIFVAASYSYRPLFPVMSSFSLVMRKDLAILPSFGRKYPWNDGQVDDSKYVY